MRIWDVSPSILCQKHLLGEHRELHAIWTVITKNKKGYSQHPETLRWVGKLNALYLRHEAEVEEMKKRGYNHNSDLDKSEATGSIFQDEFVNSRQHQLSILKRKRCQCKLD